MAYNRWKVTLKGQDALLLKMENYANKSEEVINKTLKSKGGKIAVNHITNLIPISEDKLRRGHRHARPSQPLSVSYVNLGFIVRPKQRFNYLKYPDLGIGTSQHNEPQDFMQRGLVLSLEELTQALLQGFDELNK